MDIIRTKSPWYDTVGGRLVGTLGAPLGLIDAIHWLQRRTRKVPHSPNGTPKRGPRTCAPGISLRTPFGPQLSPSPCEQTPLPRHNMMCGAAVPTQPICTLVTRTRDHATTPRTLFEHRKIVRTPGTLFEHCVVVSSNTKTICTEMFEHRKNCPNTGKLFEQRKRVFEHQKIVRTPKTSVRTPENCSNAKTIVRRPEKLFEHENMFSNIGFFEHLNNARTMQETSHKSNQSLGV